MRFSPTSLLSLFPLCALLSGCGGRDASVSPGDPVVARVGDGDIRAAQLVEAMRVRGRVAPDVFLDVSNRLVVLEELIRTRLLVEDARASGFADRPDIAGAVEQLIAGRYAAELAGAAGEGESIPADELRAFYERRADLFRTPEAVRASVILLETPSRADASFRSERLARAEALREQLLSGGLDFGVTAARYSDDQTTRYKGGDTGWISRSALEGRWPAPALEALFAMREAGSLSPVIETGSGFYLFRLDEYRAEGRLAYDVVEANVRQLAARERQQELVEKALASSRRRFGVSIDQEKVEALELPAREARPEDRGPPALPNG